ncbi:MAG: DUF92 domain-containing protein [Anaerolineales bacterium]|jgi:uncharacterized protein (TIGR00297 family)
MGYPQILAEPLFRLFLGLVLASAISFLAYWGRALSGSGALAATLVGMVVFFGGGLPAAVLLLAFFVSSSAWSRFGLSRKSQAADRFAKGSRREAVQVMANGAVPTLIAGVLLPLGLLRGVAWGALAGSLAAATADTWGTEIGLLAGKSPRLITTGRPVEAGTSGGITWQGTLAGLVGSFWIAVFALVFPGNTGRGLDFLVAITFAGVAGSGLDSWLGATLQARYECSRCGKKTEHHPLHRCGGSTFLVGGQPWANNEVINFLCTLAGGLLGGVLLFVL